MNSNYPQGGAIPLPNPSYPMAHLNGSAYAAPLNYNQPSEVVGGYDAKINPMTGEEIPQVNFARGGEVGLASLLASRGRGGDSMLVHMNPEEVKGLQALALAHGGSLTVNPDTGLVEALSLKSILPQIAGAVLNRFAPNLGKAVGTTLGFSEATAGNVGAGLIVGGITGLVEGDLKKGLQAGLGAYSGATLSSGLTAAQQAAEQAKVATTAPPTITPRVTSDSKFAGDFGVGEDIMELSAPRPVATTTAPVVATPPAPPPVEIKPSFMGGIRGLFTPEGQKAFGTALGGGFESPFAQSLSRYATFAGAAIPFTEQPKAFPTGGTGQDLVYIPGGRNPQYGTGKDQPYYLPGQYYKRTDKGLVPQNPFARGFADGGMVGEQVGVIGPFGGDMAVVGGSPGFTPAFATQAAAPASPFQGPINVPAYAAPTTDPNVLATRSYIEELNRRVRAPYVAPSSGGEAGRGLSSFGGMGLPIDTSGAGGAAGGGGGAASGIGGIVGGIAANYLVNKGLDAGLGYLQDKFTGKKEPVDTTGEPAPTEPTTSQAPASNVVPPVVNAVSPFMYNVPAEFAGTPGFEITPIENPDYPGQSTGAPQTSSNLAAASVAPTVLTGAGAYVPATASSITPIVEGTGVAQTYSSAGSAGAAGAEGAGAAGEAGLGGLKNKIIPGLQTALGAYETYEGIRKGEEGRAALGGFGLGTGLAGLGALGSTAPAILGGAPIGTLAGFGPVGLAAAAIAAIGASMVNTKEFGDVALRNYWKGIDEGRGIGESNPQELAQGFINFYRTNKNEFPGQAKYGRTGNEDFVYDMTQVINNAVKDGKVGKDVDATTMYKEVVQPWLNSMGSGPQDADARRIQDFMMTDLIHNFMQGAPISNAQVKGDKNFKIVSEKPVYAGAPPALNRTIGGNAVPNDIAREMYAENNVRQGDLNSWAMSNPIARMQALGQMPAPQSPFAAPEERATIMPIGESVPITPYGPLETPPPGPGLAGDDGKVVSGNRPITLESPVQEFVGTPYMPPIQAIPVQQPEAPVYVPRGEAVPITPYGPLETSPGPGLAGDDGRVITQPFGEAVPISPVVQEPAAADFIRRSLAANRAYAESEPSYNPYMDFSAEPMFAFAGGGAVGNDYNFGFAQGGRPMEYMAGGKFLQGPGDGMSDDIKANIDGKQEARLADGEFVIPADVVSHLGNGSSNAGAKKLHQMMARVRQSRTGKKKQAPAVKMDRYLPA